MTAQQQRLKPIGFWSYARQDDEASDGRLSQLRGQLARELQQVYGRDPINLWQDVAAIPPGAEWEKAIDDAIAQSTFLIPIITPAFVESEFCCREVAKFFDRETEINAAHPELQGYRRIFPIIYIGADDSDPFDPNTVTRLKKLQFVDFRQLREDDDPQQIRKAVVRLAAEIARLLKIKVMPAPSPEELAERLRKDAEQARKEEKRKRAEEEAANRKAEEERFEAERVALARQEEERLQQEAERQRLEELQSQRDEERAARIAARQEWQRKAQSLPLQALGLVTAPIVRRTVRIFAIGALVLLGLFILLIIWFMIYPLPPEDGAAGLPSTAAAGPAKPKPAITPEAARRLVGTWTLESIPCSEANAENGRQELAWSQGEGWKINGASVKGEDAPNSDGWFEIDGLFWRVEGEKLQLSVQAVLAAADNSITSFNRCAG